MRAGVYAGVALAILVVGLATLYEPLGSDQSAFFYIGRAWLHGAVPFRDAFDIKPPGIYAVYAAALGLFGERMESVRTADILCTLAGCLCLVRFGELRWNLRIGAIAGALCGLIYFVSADYVQEAQCESFA